MVTQTTSKYSLTLYDLSKPTLKSFLTKAMKYKIDTYQSRSSATAGAQPSKSSKYTSKVTCIYRCSTGISMRDNTIHNIQRRFFDCSPQSTFLSNTPMIHNFSTTQSINKKKNTHKDDISSRYSKSVGNLWHQCQTLHTQRLSMA